MTQPHYKGKSFKCPHCAALAQMRWERLYIRENGAAVPVPYQMAGCIACNAPSIWFGALEQVDGKAVLTAGPSNLMLWPKIITAPLAHVDLPPACRTEYEEARGVMATSPRAAAALLRLCIQKLCIELGRKEKNINDAIGGLVKDGLPSRVQAALDIVRVVGNNAVHPGQLTLEDHAEQASALFDLVNIIVEQMVSQPKRINEMYANLPNAARQAIQRRDGN